MTFNGNIFRFVNFWLRKIEMLTDPGNYATDDIQSMLLTLKLSY